MPTLGGTFTEGERWSRGCGNGIGLSAHKTGYRNVVLCGDQWVESQEADKNPLPPLNMKHSPRWVSTMQDGYKPDGKYGPSIMEHKGMAEETKFLLGGVPAHRLFRHGSDVGPLDTSFVSTAELAFAEPELEKPRVQSHLWEGTHKHDKKVSMGTLRTGQSTALRAKAGGINGEEPFVYETTTEATLGATARRVAAGEAEPREVVGGTGTSEFTKSCNSVHRAMRLRT
ncbi:unnamed protein product [Pedinophyceae sp. YPF-701]|nr:unnamed protein product [Pedinophyceae sp. YPF-701]